MATLTATRCNPIVRTFYQRLCAAGTAEKVSLVAGLWQLLTMLYAMLRDHAAWQPPMIATA